MGRENSQSERAQDGGAGGRDELHRRTFAVGGDAAEQRRSGGRGHGKAAVGAIDKAAADVHWRAVPAIDVERGEADGGAGDVDDGIDRADLVKMYLIEWHIVDGGFGFGREAQRRGGRARGLRRGSGALIQDVADGRQVAAVVMGRAGAGSWSCECG